MITPAEVVGKKVIFACFDWGMGHLMRSIPLIQQLENQENEVFFMGSNAQIQVLKAYGFNGSSSLLDGSDLKFSGSGNFVLEGLRNFFRGPKFIQRDKKAVKAILKTVKADYIISDHRYGFWSSKVTSIFLTHQVNLPEGTPSLVVSFHRNWMRNFQVVWVMDDPNLKLAGVLSDCPSNGTYIGFYSRFQNQVIPTSSTAGIVAIISGPAPYSSQFFEEIVRLADQFQQPIQVVCSNEFSSSHPFITCIHSMDEADRVIASASLLVSRNGYTTLMDLVYLKKSALLLATPGQAEQLYFAAHCQLPNVEMVTTNMQFEAAFSRLILS